MNDYIKALEGIKPFLPEAEFKALRYYVMPAREERDAIGAIIQGMAERINTMPQTYDQDGKADQATVYLHYFFGGSDWYITEKDKEGPGTTQAFGFAILNGDLEMAELGYISIEEITEIGGELDMYFDPCTLAEVKAKHGIYERIA